VRELELAPNSRKVSYEIPLWCLPFLSAVVAGNPNRRPVVVLAMGAVESARLALNSLGGIPNAGEIGRNINAMDAGKCCDRRNVGPLDEGVRMRRAHDMAPQTIGTLGVGDVTAASGEEADVLDPPD